MKKSSLALSVALCALTLSHAQAANWPNEKDREKRALSAQNEQRTRNTCGSHMRARCCGGILQYAQDCWDNSGSRDKTQRTSYFSWRIFGCCGKKTKG